MILPDTSVLTAAMISSHVHHERSVSTLQKIRKGDVKGAVSAHSLAECYANLTAYPMSPRILPEDAEKMIEENLTRWFTVVELTAMDYRAAIRRVRERNLRSGAIYDALILQAALKKKAEALYTWNVEDFERLAGKELPILRP